VELCENSGAALGECRSKICDVIKIKNRNTKQLVKKIKRFKDWIFNHEEYQVTYYGIGDGICVIKRK
jgi:predicted O-methyltransferase YrrM